VTKQADEFNQRTMRAIILCVLVAVVYTQLFLSPQKRTAQPVGASSGASVSQPVASQPETASGASARALPAQQAAPVQVVGASPSPLAAHVSKAQLEAAPLSFVNSATARVTLAHLGGRVISYQLSQYRAHHGEEALLDLVNSPDGAVFPLGVYVGGVSDEGVVYTLSAVNGAKPTGSTANLVVASGGTVTVELSGKLSNGTGITKRITFADGSYLIGVEVLLDRPSTETQPVWLEWSRYYPQSEDTKTTPSHVTYLDGFDKVRHVPIAELPEGVRDFGTSKWVGIGDIYFTATLIPNTAGRNTLIGHQGDVYLSRVAGGAAGGTFSVYAGPKDLKILRTIEGLSLERSIDLGWFSFLALPLLSLLHILYSTLHNYGLAIIGLTLIVKTVMLPLSKASFESMKKMQELQPEIKALKERVTDPTQLNQEIFALYQRRGVNPMGGCLPIVIQIPVFLGLYQALLNAIDLRHAAFGVWITDLSAPERLDIWGIGVPVMVLLMAGSMILQQKTMPNTVTDPAQQRMMALMPYIFAGMFIIFPMPAGLVLYWLVNNLISITQQIYMRNTDKGSVYVATLVASVLIFGVGYIVTLI
jgi:YidC/Oxa1 family membrane protein insertase